MKKVTKSLGELIATFRTGLEKSAAEGGSMTPEEMEELQAAQAAQATPAPEGAEPELDPAAIPAGDGDMGAADMDPVAVAAPAVDSGSAIDAAVQDVAAAATQSAEAVAALKDIAKTASAKGGEAIIKSAEEFGRHFAKAIVAELGSNGVEDTTKEASEQLDECFNGAYLSTMLKVAGELSYALTLDKLAADVAAEPEEETAPDASVKGKGENASLESVPGYMENLKKSEGTDASLEEIPGSVDELKKLTKNAYDLTMEKVAFGMIRALNLSEEERRALIDHYGLPEDAELPIRNAGRSAVGFIPGAALYEAGRASIARGNTGMGATAALGGLGLAGYGSWKASDKYSKGNAQRILATRKRGQAAE